MQQEVYKIALLGYGTVGSGVAKALRDNGDKIARRVGAQVQLAAICDLRDFKGDENEALIVHDFDSILKDESICLVAECIGGAGAAYTMVSKALEAKKHVVTSNKELIATHGDKLLQLAAQNGVKLCFEASVGGTIPLINVIANDLASNRIEEISGILNGTTNFMLSCMQQRDYTFEQALKLAQQLGYAETIDPSFDTDGHDAARKICILASLAFGVHVLPKDIYTKGISGVKKEHIAAAKDAGYEIRLIAHTKRAEDGVYCSVQPMAVPADSLFAGVQDSFNAALLSCDLADQVFLCGRGAGSLPTASAMVADIMGILAGGAPAISWQPPKEGYVLPDPAVGDCLVMQDGRAIEHTQVNIAQYSAENDAVYPILRGCQL